MGKNETKTTSLLYEPRRQCGKDTLTPIAVHHVEDVDEAASARQSLMLDDSALVAEDM